VAIAAAAIAALIIIAGMLAYTGTWPPLVVVESDSMQHSDERSSIGIIDIGDLVFVKKTDQIVTYLEGTLTDHRTYGGYGDVVIYRPYGSDDRKPIIHRPICRLEYNASGGGFDVPELAQLPEDRWNVVSHPNVWWNLSGVLELYHIGHKNATLRINLDAMLDYFEESARQPHGGFITMGDNNIQWQGPLPIGLYDQISICQEPIPTDWVVGKARGEIPWFGLMKLWLEGDAPDNVPQNSKTNLFVSIGLIIGVPIALDTINLVMKRRGVEIFGWVGKIRWRLRSGFASLRDRLRR